MLTMQLHDAGSSSYPTLMGLSAEGQLVQHITESIAERVVRIRARMLAVGISAAVGTGLFTTLTFAGAFHLARTERVWAPAFLLGGVGTMAALVSVALAAKAVADAEASAAAATTTVTTTALPALPAPLPIRF